MSYQPSITQYAVMEALRTFLLTVLPANTEVVKAQSNGVAMPKGAFACMTEVGMERLATNIDGYNPTASTKDIETPTKHTVQVDFYGPMSGDWAAAVQSLFRDESGVAMFPPTVVPLYADNPIQMPMLTEESTYLQRWKLDVAMQFNPMLTVAQQFADEVSVGLISVDVVYPP